MFSIPAIQIPVPLITIKLSVLKRAKEDIRIVVHGIPVNQKHLTPANQTPVVQEVLVVNVRHGSLQRQVQ